MRFHKLPALFAGAIIPFASTGDASGAYQAS